MTTPTIEQRCMKYFSEFLGTFLFLSVILLYAGTLYAGFPIGLALGIMVFAFGYISGGMYNPAVTTMFKINGDLDWIDWAFYIIFQMAGGVAALYYFKAAKTNHFIPPNTIPKKSEKYMED
jgi:aquaporin Z